MGATRPPVGAEVKVLRFVAILVLIGGVLAGIGFIASGLNPESATVEGVPELGLEDITVEESGTPQILLGIFFLVQGLVGWALLSAIASITESAALTAWQTAEMRGQLSAALSQRTPPPPPLA
ncbi:MAG: hypothetical protein ABR505_06580 [Actinomycetota bacterium]